MGLIPLPFLRRINQIVIWRSPWGEVRGRLIFDLVLIAAGCLLMAISMGVFLDPNNVVPGGFTALAMFANRLWGWPVGLTLLAMNVPFLVIGVRVLGPSFGPKAILGATLLSLFIDLLRPYLPVVQGEPLLYTLYGGLLFGLGQGLVFRANATTGGTETPAKLLEHFYGTRMSRSLLAMDVIVLGLAAAFFGLAPALYALVAAWVMARVIEYLEVGFSASDSAFIVTKRPDVVQSAILEKLERGVTVLRAVGGYTGHERLMLFTVVGRREVSELREIVLEADPGAFMVISPSTEVLGEGFKPLARPRLRMRQSRPSARSRASIRTPDQRQ